MSMQARLMAAMALAFLSHGMLLLMPVAWDNTHPANLAGSKSITVQLSAARQAASSAQSAAKKVPAVQPVTGATFVEPVTVSTTVPATPALQIDQMKQPAISEPPSVARKPPQLTATSRKILRQTKTPRRDQPATEPVIRQDAGSGAALPDLGGHANVSGPTQKETESSASGAAIVKARPYYKNNAKPSYPPLAIRRNWQGVVVLAVQVSAAGTVKGLRVEKSSGYELLDEEAVVTVKRWQFIPGTRKGVAIAMEVLVPVRFVLK